MRFLKVIVFLFFLPKLFHAQELPIWEANTFAYTKYSIGRDFPNVESIWINPDGSVLARPYGQSIFKIKNQTTELFYENTGAKGRLLHYAELKKQNIYFFDHAIFYKKNNKEIPLFPSSVQYNVGNVVSLNNQLYIEIHFQAENSRKYYRYDGTQLKEFFHTKNPYTSILKINHNVFISESNTADKTTTLYQINQDQLKKFRTYPFVGFMSHILNEDNFYFYFREKQQYFSFKNGIINTVPFLDENRLNSTLFTENYNRKFSTFYTLWPNLQPLFFSTASESFYSNTLSKESNSYYLTSGGILLRAFPDIRKYPRMFNKTNSNQIFSLNQTQDGKIWVGSYNANLSVIDHQKVKESKIHDYRFMGGGTTIRNRLFLNTEAKEGILSMTDENHYTKISDTITAFYNFLSSDNLFFAGTTNYGLMYKNYKDIDNKKIPWKFVHRKEGLDLINCITIVEDRFGNIWTGRSSEGIAVYNPKTNKAKTWRIDTKEIPFGSMSMLKDDRQTLWIGTSTGELIYWNGKTKDDRNPKNFVKISHPLLNLKESGVNFIHQWKDWLILGAAEKVLLFNLKEWYQNKKVIVRYLSSQEASFSSITEQNAVLTDHRDQSIWFSTSDMLYQWNIENWLKRPTFKAIPEIQVSTGEKIFKAKSNQKIQLEPNQNSLQIDISIQTKDNLPRYLHVQLLKEGEKFVSNTVSTSTQFDFQNLSSGKYVLHVLICQQDGSFDTFLYPIIIKKFFWQNWWFWVLASLFPIGFLYFYFSKKREVEKQKKIIAQLNVSTLSSQFRPHFMLNALNSLGTDMDDKPHAEKVISRIGENISLMFDYSQNQKFYTTFKNEWKLVKNTIEIQKIIFIKELIVEIQNENLIPENYPLPLGVIQIHVENALLHGIRHRKSAPYLIKIEFSEDKNHYLIQITDNGVGRKNSSKMYDFRKNGTGLKNLESLIEIINSEMPESILVEIKDENEISKEYPGTIIRIKLNKNMNYEKFKF